MHRRLALLLLLGSACAAARPSASPAPVEPTARAPARPCGPYGDEPPGARRPLEARAWAELLRARSGRRLEPSGALDRAARVLAEDAAQGAPDPIGRRRIQDALRVGGAFDPSPTAHLASGAADEALAAAIARAAGGEATHAGVGEAEAGGVHHVVLLLSSRRARLEPFPGALDPGGEAILRGRLLGLHHPRAWVTRPDGSSQEATLHGGQDFSASLRFPGRGIHAVELTGDGPRGPEVAALLAVSTGGAPCAVAPPEPAAPEPDDPLAAERAVVAAANRLRLGAGLAPLSPAPELSRVARRHAEAMRAAGLVAHVLPGSGDLAARLRAAGLPFRRALENVASGPTSLEAHAAVEASPAHRANLLAPSASSIGVGVARGALPTGEAVAYLAEILVEPQADAAAGPLTPDARVREALWRERARRGLPPLTSDPSLEALARRAAAEMRRDDEGEVRGLSAEALRLGRDLAAADAFIASDPAEALRSRNLPVAGFRRVGVGVVSGDSRRFGPGRLFIAVIYTD